MNKNNIRCIIVDDEPLARKGIEAKVLETGFMEVVGMFSGGLQAHRFLAENDVDLMFLDIQMPDITGLDLLKTLKKPPMIVFTTAYSEFALNGFEHDAIDYLLKPIDFQRFLKAANKVKERFDFLQLEKNSEKNIEKNEVEAIGEDFIYIRADRQFIKVPYKDIRYIEGMKNYAMVYTTSQKHMTAISLQKIIDQLPDTQFARINKSFIVNIAHIERIALDFIVLDKKTELPLGKAFQEHFITKYVKGNLLERK
jgi:DNA-binding LytR/AlgR family response regulator